MAFKINKPTLAELESALEDAETANTNLEEAITAFNALVRDEFRKLQEIAETQNAAVEAAKEIVEGIVEEMQNEFEDRSDKWKESERANSVESWLNEWQEFAGKLDEITFSPDNPEEIEFEASVVMGESFKENMPAPAPESE